MPSKKLHDIVFKLHRYIGLIVGLVLVVVGLTGSLLVFEPELRDLAIHREVGAIAAQGEPLSPDEIVDQVKAVYAKQPGVKVNRISLSAYSRLYQDEVVPRNVAVEGRDDVWIDNYINPYNGEILAKHKWQRSVWDYVFKLHYELLAGSWGLYFVGVVGLLATLLSVTGIVLWPGWRKLIAGFAIKRQAHPKRRNYDIHKVVGIVAAIFLAMATFTGFCWNFWDWSVPLIYAATLSAKPVDPVSQTADGRSPISISRALQQAEMALPAGKTITAVLPTAPNGVFEIRKQLPGDANFWGEHTVYLDQYSGDVIRVETTATNLFGTKLLNSFATVHYGTFGGVPTRILYVLVGLAPTLLLSTGFVMYRYRYKGEKKSTPPDPDRTLSNTR